MAEQELPLRVRAICIPGGPRARALRVRQILAKGCGGRKFIGYKGMSVVGDPLQAVRRPRSGPLAQGSTMRISSRAAAAALVVVAIAPSPAPAQSDSATGSGLSLYAETRLVSRYIWRGYGLSRNAASLQPWVEASLPFGLSVNAFGTSAVDHHMQLDEAQLGVGYKREVGDWEFGAGYLHYIMTGTETEPSSAADPLTTTTSGEWYLSVTRNWTDGWATLTYSRGNGTGKGNSVNLWIERDFSWGNDRWNAQPYVQVDYLDEYGAPSGFENRLSMIELGLPVLFRVGPVQLLAAAQVSFIPSPYVRAANRDADATGNIVLPWFSFGIVYEP